MPFEIFYLDLPKFLESLSKLSHEQRQAVFKTISLELAEREITSPITNTSKALGQGLFELRVRRNPDLLIRVFWTYNPGGRIVVLSAYDKKRDSSELTQHRQISRARALLDSIRREG